MKNTLILASVAAVACVVFSCCAPKVETSLPHRIKNGRVVLDVPPRAEGQQSALLLTCPPLDTVKVGFIGLGMRGEAAVYRFTYIDGIKITALCDLEPDRVTRSQKGLLAKGWPEAAEYSG